MKTSLIYVRTRDMKAAGVHPEDLGFPLPNDNAYYLKASKAPEKCIWEIADQFSPTGKAKLPWLLPDSIVTVVASG